MAKQKREPRYMISLNREIHERYRKVAKREQRTMKIVAARALDAYERQNGNALTAGSTHNDTR